MKKVINISEKTLKNRKRIFRLLRLGYMLQLDPKVRASRFDRR